MPNYPFNCFLQWRKRKQEVILSTKWIVWVLLICWGRLETTEDDEVPRQTKPWSIKSRHLISCVEPKLYNINYHCPYRGSEEDTQGASCVSGQPDQAETEHIDLMQHLQRLPTAGIIKMDFALCYTKEDYYKETRKICFLILPNILQKVQSSKPIQLLARTFPLDVTLQLAAMKQC